MVHCWRWAKKRKGELPDIKSRGTEENRVGGCEAQRHGGAVCSMGTFILSLNFETVNVQIIIHFHSRDFSPEGFNCKILMRRSTRQTDSLDQQFFLRVPLGAA